MSTNGQASLRLSSHSRPRSSRHTTSSVPYVTQTESLILPDGAIGEGAAELLNDLVHHRHHEGQSEATLFGDEAENLLSESGVDETNDQDELDKRRNLPWWKRPSPWWLMVLVPFSTIAMSATLAPRIEIYTILVCSVQKPEVFKHTFMGFDLGHPNLSNGAGPGDIILRPSVENSSFPFDLALDRVYLPEDHGAVKSRLGLQKRPDKGTTNPNPCASDPVVQAAVAKLTAVLAATMGILGCLTTAWWGSFSDRHGRTRVMGISVFGLLLTDINFIFVSHFSHQIPGGYWFLVVGPIAEGLLGGMTSSIAATHAYIADTTNVENRSRTFSLSLGLMFCGVALGPTLGGLLIRFTHQPLSVFYVATCLHFTYAFFVWFVIPESLSLSQMTRSRVRHSEQLRDAARDRELNLAVGALVRAKRLFTFLSPLTIFMPERVNPLKGWQRDWNLTLLAAAYGFTISIMGSYTYIFQYASSAFGWTSENIGYWLSLIGAVRAIYLALILPVVIKLFKPKPVYIRLPSEPSESDHLLSSTPSPAPEGASSSSNLLPDERNHEAPNYKKEIHSPAFDLALARVSLLIEIISYALMGLAPTPLAFTVFSLLGSIGTGFSPALQSVALEMYARRGGTESGKLFGALSVIQALSSQILGPAVFGLVYMKTVATFPRAIFSLCVSAVIISFIFLSLVRLPKAAHDAPEGHLEGHDIEPGLHRDATLVDIDIDGRHEARDRKLDTPVVITASAV